MGVLGQPFDPAQQDYSQAQMLQPPAQAAPQTPPPAPAPVYAPAAAPMSNFSGMLDPQVALPVAAALMGGRTFKDSLAGGFAAAGPGLAQVKKRAAWNAWLKAGAKQDPNDPTYQALMSEDPSFAEKMALTQASKSAAGPDYTAEMKNYRAGQADPSGFGAYDKSLHPSASQDSPMNVGRWTRAANAAVSPYMKLSAYNLVQNAAPYLSRIEAVSAAPGSVSDQELLDSVVKLNTGGNQVTEAQVELVLGGRSLADQASVWANYMAANGGVLSDDQRKQLQDVAHAVYRGYQKMYKPIYDAAQKSLKDRHIPEEYWGAIPDLNQLSSAGGISPEGNPVEGAAPAAGSPAAGAPADPLGIR